MRPMSRIRSLRLRHRLKTQPRMAHRLQCMHRPHARELRSCLRQTLLRLDWHAQCTRPLRRCAMLRVLLFLSLNPNESKSNPMLSKSQEIQILSDAADKLGSSSYCGAWLREQIPFIESDIRSDFAPGILASASIQDCARRCAEMRADAMRERDGILSDARKEADQIRAQAVRFNELQREELKRTLKAILSRID